LPNALDKHLRKTNEPYPIEVALSKILKEIATLIKKGGRFFFTIPDKKMDKYIYVIETISWLFLTLAIILGMIRR
jgi:hypothetical protein